MNCEELKKQLLEKDAQVKARTENTIKCFELIKDWVVDDLVKRTIDDEFSKCGHLLYSKDIYENLFSVLNIDTSLLRWDYMRESFWSRCIIEEIYFCNDSYAYQELDDYEKADIQMKNVSTFKVNFDRGLFEKLIVKHIRSFGFENKVIKNIHGQKVTTNFFVISRERLENKCCVNPKMEDDKRESSENIWSGILVLVAVAIIAFVYAMS